MGVQERKAREQRALKRKIIKAAKKLFLQHGYEGTSIRMIARAIEYSPATLYLHFQNKNELFKLILEEAFEVHAGELKGAKMIADPFSRLQEMCRRYINFAEENSFYYDLFYNNKTAYNQEIEQSRYSEQTNEIFKDNIKACKRDGYFLSKDPDIISLTIWSFLHGLISLRQKNRLNNYTPNELELLQEQCFKEFFMLLNA